MPVLVPGYHFGVVVADLDRAMTELNRLLGVEWLEPVRSGHQVTDAEAQQVGPMITFSKQGPPYFELLEQTPGTIWDVPGLHHVGFWAADVKGESARLADAGYPLQAAAVVLAGDAEPGVCYHRTSDGLLLELVEIYRGAPALTYYLGGGAH
ncbi:VOC family protein [Nocardia sp. NBC_01388]|uniref:VOC family protein n=1 Tax=Nocardia sp. NBC_01388 TaxID=2903596 RepID=UPI003245B01B